MKIKIFTILVIFAIVGCNNTQKSSENTASEINNEPSDSIENMDTAHKIANASGFENWKDVSEISFTFNVDRDGNHFYRSWVWNPKTGDVQMNSEKGQLSYNRSKLDSLAMKTDASFINDKYWLLAPFQIAWDKGTSFTEKENVEAPISKDALNRLTVVYGNAGGYTPGDAYDLFYDKNYKIKEWNYRKDNAPEPTMTTTWEDYKNFGGIDIATMHTGATGNFKLYFTDISVKK
ncbi:hypothetical protein [Aequorivita capsosiphonis]|uniref:hypothetical protein n=1 Tax=Aequorivita capsosiphonis TaxID=487317 RepID=UPI00040FEBF4|nr:hypothetical protein [Aequorivita capsosiphonis]